jgi:hypothetical protein
MMTYADGQVQSWRGTRSSAQEIGELQVLVKKPIGMRLTEIEGQGIYVSKIGFMAFYYSVYLLYWYKSTNADAARLTEIEGQGIYVSEIGFTTQFTVLL